ncbi:MAG: Gfo/Idh/MocA family oxidoreductase [Chthoniobacterales bacterium]
MQAPIFDVEDAAFAFIRFENEAVVQLKASWAGNLTDEIPQGLYFGRESNNCTIYGNRATIRLKPLTLFRDEGGELIDEPLTPPDDAGSFELQMENFIAAIVGRAAPINNAEQAVYLMEMLDAIYLSSSTGREALIAHA